MIPHIPPQRRHRSNHAKPFSDLVAYVLENKSKEYQLANSLFSDILNYATATKDVLTAEEKCVAIRTNKICALEFAATEMNAVASRNLRCKDPVFTFILSWPEHESPHHDVIFDAANHALQSLGLGEHQSVVAIHSNTDNIHCHVAVNRIHPITFRSQHLEWSIKTLHRAARESEIKHGWSNDNGIFIVQSDELGNKSIIKNVLHKSPSVLPAWHDPDSLMAWLKSDVSKALKRALPTLQNWHDLHRWLENYSIGLLDTGGGLRLEITSADSGEVLYFPASRGLRLLKRYELEARWGAFTTNETELLQDITSFPSTDDDDTDLVMNCVVPNMTVFNPLQIHQKVNTFLKSSFDQGVPPWARNQQLNMVDADEMRELNPENQSKRNLAFAGHNNSDVGTDYSDAIVESNSTSKNRYARDNLKREERKAARAIARADLRSRFNRYQDMVAEGDIEYLKQVKAIRAKRSALLATIRVESKQQRQSLKRDFLHDIKSRIFPLEAIHSRAIKQKLKVESIFQAHMRELSFSRVMPLGWRVWLHEQAKLGDQAALSALRGIVYQAQRDAKSYEATLNETHTIEIDSSEFVEAGVRLKSDEQHFAKLMSRLLNNERHENAIRSSHIHDMRPFEVDALLAQYAGIKWRVTGNGNVNYLDMYGEHIFTDRGNRITFDKVLVTDEEICLALMHAEQKFGKGLTLTGNDPLFTARMARLADELGLIILNPELQVEIANHRVARNSALNKIETVLDVIPVVPKSEPIIIEEPPTTVATPIEEILRKKILSLDPQAEFVIPSADSNTSYEGKVIAASDVSDQSDFGFAQHLGRGRYALHFIPPPIGDATQSITVKYKDGVSSIQLSQTPDKKRTVVKHTGKLNQIVVLGLIWVEFSSNSPTVSD